MAEKNIATLYLKHFGLHEAPFKITPTTEFFYGGGQRGEILHALKYGIDVGEGIMAVTGEVGSGKTMLLRTLLSQLDENINIIYIANPSLSGREILYNICEELGLKASESRPDTVHILQNYLIEQHTNNRRVIAFIDEAQAMPEESLEEIRLLSNLETNRNKLLQIILFGQPEFEEKLRQQNMRQLRERITVKMNLKPFGRDDVREYIATRLRVAGYNGASMFANDACRLIAVVSQGLSRRINVLADKAMLSAYERSSLTVNYADARKAMRDVNFGKMRYRSEQSRRISNQLTIGVAAAACFLLALAAGVRTFSDDPAIAPGSVVSAATVTVTKPQEVNNSVAAFAAETVTIALTTTVIAKEEVVESIVTQVTVVQTVTARTPEPSSQEQMLAAIADISSGERVFSSDDFALQIAENAETHGEAPQTGGGDTDWQAVAAVSPAIVDNEYWSWMPASSYLRSRLNATQTWLQEKNSNKQAYTARLITVAQERAVFIEKFLRYFSDFYPVRNVMVYPVRLSSGDKFVITFGIYSTRQDAEVFIKNVPYYFTGGKPYAQKLAVSQAEAQHAWQ